MYIDSSKVTDFYLPLKEAYGKPNYSNFETQTNSDSLYTYSRDIEGIVKEFKVNVKTKKAIWHDEVYEMQFLTVDNHSFHDTFVQPSISINYFRRNDKAEFEECMKNVNKNHKKTVVF